MYKNLNCLEVKELLSAYMDNELSQGLEEAVEIHVENCESCAETLYEMEKISTIIKTSAKRTEDSLDEDVYAKNLDKYLDTIEDCRFTEDNIDDYIDKELDFESEKKISYHLKRCKYCRYDYENLIELRLSLKNYFNKKVDNSVEENDLEKIISRIAKARLQDYLTMSLASVFVVSIFAWFSVNIVYPKISKLDDSKSIQNINLKYTHNDKVEQSILNKIQKQLQFE
jgi:anti-sigma factor RsiW